jgi:NAD(P)H-hydrate epimerase
VVARRAPLEVTSLGFPEDRDGRFSVGAWDAVRDALEDFSPDVIAVGPGLGRSPGVESLIRHLVLDQRTSVVLDADGLNSLASLKLHRKLAAPTILTPHPGEMARLLGSSTGTVSKDRRGAATTAARRYGAVALLKGAGTLVSDGRVTWMNTTGNPAMATGGMGDILTGIVAATWAQMPAQTRETAVPAAALAAFVHGLAADLAVKKFPERTLIASDLAETLPPAFQRLWRQQSPGGRR